MLSLENSLTDHFMTPFDQQGYPALKKHVKLWLSSNKPMGNGDLMRTELALKY
jgi:hypothetical protein